MLFGSADGAVVTEAAEEDYLPVLDAAAVPRSGGVVAGTTHTVRGVKAGRYRQAVLRRGTLATVEAPTAVGVEDRVRAISGGLAFEGSGPARAITLDVASAGASATIAAQGLGRERAPGRFAARVRQRRRGDDALVQAAHDVARALPRRSSRGRCGSPRVTP